jgi:hypothetical protein
LIKYKVKGKTELVSVFEIFDSNSPELIDLKIRTRSKFEQGVVLYNSQEISQAHQLFQNVLQLNEQDRAAQLYIRRCEQLQKQYPA